MEAQAPCGHTVTVADELHPEGDLWVECGEDGRRFSVQVLALPATAGGALYVNAWGGGRPRED